MLNARCIGEEAERVALSLPLAQEEAFGSFYSYLIVDEPAVHLMPLHFLPDASRGRVDEGFLRELSVAAKLEYARNRWLDELVDNPGSVTGVSSAHRLNEALIGLIHSRYAGVLDANAAAAFFPVLLDLHARHGLSLILDSTWSRNSAPFMTVREYAGHAKTRHGPVRAPLDAVLFSVGAADSLLERARDSWHNWALGVQFYDDALDIEEDFQNHNLSWTVSRTLEYYDEQHGNTHTPGAPTSDAFYEKAMTEGIVSETLGYAGSYFAESARLAEPAFPSWVAYQRACLDRTRLLREDYERLIAEA